ncbi:hypothetical protein STAL104432_07815 [Streptomyces albus]
MLLDDLVDLAEVGVHLGLGPVLRLVAADGDVRAGREVREFTDHVVEELVGDVLVHAQVAVGALREAGVGLQRLAVAVQLGVGGQRGVCVVGAVDLRDDGDAARRRVLHDVLVVGLGEVAAEHAADAGLAADLGEFRPGLDGDAPALVVGEVQMQVIHLVAGDGVDVLLDVLHRHEVPAHVEHRAAVAVARRVGYPAALDAPGAGHLLLPFDLHRQQLAQCRDAVEEAAAVVGPDADRPRVDVELVALLLGHRVLPAEGEHDALRVVPRRQAAYRQGVSRGLAQQAGQELRCRLGGGGALGRVDRVVRFQVEGDALVGRDLHGLRYDRAERHGALRSGRVALGRRRVDQAARDRQHDRDDHGFRASAATAARWALAGVHR